MIVCGHTLGTPYYSVKEAIDLFKVLKLDGAEVIFANDYKSGIPEVYNPDGWKNLKEYIDMVNLPILALTPYMYNYSSLDNRERLESVQKLKDCIECAKVLGAKNIRVYGGKLFKDDNLNIRKKRENHLIEILKECAYIAEKYQIFLNIENHHNTLCQNAQETVNIVNRVNSSAVNILYDQANLDFVLGEDYQTAIDLQFEYIKYVHVKDYQRISHKPLNAKRIDHTLSEERTVKSKILGEGDMEWTNILKKLKRKGYNGIFSIEAENRWHPDELPDSKVMFSKGAEYLRKIWERLE